MTNIYLKQAQADFEDTISSISDSKKDVLKFRNKFVKYFNMDKINNMTIEEYALGYVKDEEKLNFCYGLETQLKALGWMVGGTSRKFGFWYGIEKNDPVEKFRIVKKLGTKNKNNALKKIRNAIIELLNAGKTKDIKVIRNNILSPMLKGKILSTYFPNQYLNIFSKTHLEYFVNKLNIPTEEILHKDEIELRELILEYKNKDNVYSKWSIDIFVDFLFYYYGSPKKEGIDSPKDPKKQSISLLKKYKRLDFPLFQKAELVNLDIENPIKTNKGSKLTQNTIKSSLPNYEEQSIRNTEIGDRGEKIVMDFEFERLKQSPKLQKRIRQVSKTSNQYGYDILSFEEDESKRYIEVKATRAKVGDANFYLTINELNTAKELDNYFIYVVFEIETTTPKIWIIQNPFNPENKNISLIPINFSVLINTKSQKK
jgi:hypothetical protein